jgi:cobalt-precorrin-5B (C1)-methyltransferase
MSGDHIGRSLEEARRLGVRSIHVAAQWAKLLKVAMGTPDTHVRAGAFDTAAAAAFLRGLGIGLPQKSYNTAREMFDSLKNPARAVRSVCAEAARYAERLSGADVRAVLVGYDGKAVEAGE